MKVAIIGIAAFVGAISLIATLIAGGLAGASAGGVGCPTVAVSADLASAGITQEKMTNASIIVQVGQRMRVPQRGWVIAVATAMQESDLVNSPTGDRDSVGLFQQRPSQGWGTVQDLMRPDHAAELFYRKMLTVSKWESRPLTVVAQAVQGSAFPNAYAKHEPLAVRIVNTILTAPCLGVGPFGARVVRAARSVLGTPYRWGAGGYNGPTGGHIDCSGLTMFAIFQASDGKIRLPHRAGEQVPFGHVIPALTQAAPGDLIFFHTPGDAPGRQHHVVIYLGMRQPETTPRQQKTANAASLIPWVIHAPDVGQQVREQRLWFDGDEQTIVRYG